MDGQVREDGRQLLGTGFSIEECKRLGVPYMQEGWSEGLLEYLSDDDSLRIEILGREANM